MDTKESEQIKSIYRLLMYHFGILKRHIEAEEYYYLDEDIEKTTLPLYQLEKFCERPSEGQGGEHPLNGGVIPAETLKALCDLQMVSDPYPLSDSHRHLIDEFLDDQSGRHNLNGWVEAYHNL